VARVLAAALTLKGAPALVQAPSVRPFKLPSGQGSATPPGTLGKAQGHRAEMSFEALFPVREGDQQR